MTYNPKHELTRRQERREKRIRPEKKSSPSGNQKTRWPTKPKNHAKIAELKAHRGQQISDAIDCSDLEHEIECDRLENIAHRQYLDDLLALEIYCYTNIPESERDLFMLTHGPIGDCDFSIYADGWPY